jgi:hypothetical protein
LDLLGDFPGTVFVPESPDGELDPRFYEDQLAWEWDALEIATLIVFWVPRNLTTLPAFTTNIEFGMYWNSGKILAGAPNDAPKNEYLRALARRGNVPWFNNLHGLLAQAVIRIRQKSS